MKLLVSLQQKTPPPGRHAVATIGLHWLSALAVAAVFLVAWTRAGLEDPHPRKALMLVHQCIGLFVLALLFFLVGTRIATWPKRPRHDIPLPVRWVASGTHLALYGALLAMPLLGWALANAQGHAVRLPGLATLPALAGADPDLADTLEAWHAGLSWTLFSLVALHALAALFHHFVRRDDVMGSMMPGAPPRARERVRTLRPTAIARDARSR